MRQYGIVPPVLSTAQAPKVSATSGLGTGGGAGVRPSSLTPSDGQGQFAVDLVFGSNPSVGGSVTLVFATTPPVLFIAGSDALGTITAPNNDGAHTTITISWTAQPRINSRQRIACEWSVSQ